MLSTALSFSNFLKIISRTFAFTGYSLYILCFDRSTLQTTVDVLNPSFL